MRNWDDMKAFLAVARAESLSAAGKSLRVDPATVGRRISRLEAEMAVPLFAKSPQGYALTIAGQRLQAHAERVEQAMQDGVEAVSGDPNRLTGLIRLGAPDGCANFLLPQVCAAIMDDNPDLEIQIIALPRDFNLTRREADLAIAVSAPTAGRLAVQKITDYHLVLGASRDYLARHGPITALEDLAGHRMVGYIPDMIFDKELDYLSEFGIDRVGLASNSVSVQMNWVRQGCGLGVLHDFALPFAPEVVPVLPDRRIRRSYYLLRHVDDLRLERLGRFASALSEGLRREVTLREGNS
ncbi:LysR family transcriptional regulator [Poseidonocella sedimentorum]|uniref:DNA-binding transcriptional regulator, LysR family n=1 Tax=Poseidonocella sedimentorum TaxID=871652 RepID=A0A1I6EHV8_9RHOB|nr:LysR family transcriptional regulator [Poseidonocella sedimentorum]SFR17340.1 DNA-binding transcriptional regulator, LysR family [Poseidonocella sedimentorum]